MSVIKTIDLTKNYKNLTAVDKLNIEVNEGELFALLGVNGAGKTTTVKMLATLTRPDGGDAFVCGHSIVKERDKVRGLIDISMQETAIARKLTVRENLEFYAKLKGFDRQTIKEKVDAIFNAFGFDKVAEKYAAKLSGGWQRKLSIALALISEPKVLFLDEPTLGLDVIARRELWAVIEKLKEKTTIVLTTHYMEEAEALADVIAVMKDGRLLFIGNKEKMFEATGKRSVEDAFIELVTKDGAL